MLKLYGSEEYVIDLEGNVFRDGKSIEVKKINGKPFVKLLWLGEYKYWNVAQLIIGSLYIFFNDYVRKNINPRFRDNNPANVAVTNLFYDYGKRPLKHPTMSGFYHIPYFPFYVINVQGDLYSLLRKRLMTFAMVPPNEKTKCRNGYFYARMLNHQGRSIIGLRHRLLCLTFKHYSSDPDELVINHLNGCGGNDDLKNMEWTTRELNCKHAYAHGLINNTVACVSRNIRTGEIRKYRSLTDAAREHGYSGYTVVVNRIVKGKNTNYPDGMQFKFDDDSEWEDLSLMKMAVPGSLLGVYSREVDTGAVTFYVSAADCERQNKISAATILKQCRQKTNKVYNGKHFRFTATGEWPS